MATPEYLIRRRIEIDTAHRVPHHSSKCYNLHGHRYVIEAEVRGPVIASGEQTGMVIDFGFIKDIMIQEIHDPCDHGLILYREDNYMLLMVTEGSSNIKDGRTTRNGIKLLVLDSVPTAENLAQYWFTQVGTAMRQFWVDRDDVPFSQHPKLHCIRVHETPNCMAQYPVGES